MGKPQVMFIHSDAAVRDSFAALVESERIHVRPLSSVEEFWQAYDPSHQGCVVLDVGHLRVEQVLAFCQDQRLRHPVIVLTEGDSEDRRLRTARPGIRIVRPLLGDDVIESVHSAILPDERVV